MTRKWLEGAAGLRLETVTKSFTKRTDKRADELISGSLTFTLPLRKKNTRKNVTGKAFVVFTGILLLLAAGYFFNAAWQEELSAICRQ